MRAICGFAGRTDAVFRRSLLVLAACCAVLLTAAPAHAAPGIVDDDPAVAGRGAGDMRAVIRGSDGALWTRSWNGSSWTGWVSLGGALTSGPAISARPLPSRTVSPGCGSTPGPIDSITAPAQRSPTAAPSSVAFVIARPTLSAYASLRA